MVDNIIAAAAVAATGMYGLLAGVSNFHIDDV
jgi:hypothetical protein